MQPAEVRNRVHLKMSYEQHDAIIESQTKRVLIEVMAYEDLIPRHFLLMRRIIRRIRESHPSLPNSSVSLKTECQAENIQEYPANSLENDLLLCRITTLQNPRRQLYTF